MKLKKKLNKTGVNSKMVLIDKKIIEWLELEDYVNMEVKNSKIIITKYKEDEKHGNG